MGTVRGAGLAAAAISIALHLAAAAAFLRPPEAGPAPAPSVEVWLAPAPSAAPSLAARKQAVPSRVEGPAAPAPRRAPPPLVSPDGSTAEPAPAPIPPPASASVATTPDVAPASSVAGSSRPEDSFAAYARLVWSRIDRQRPRSDVASGVAQVAFSLDRDGRLITLRLAASSGTPAFDRAAIRSVRAAAPFPRPPQDIDPTRLVFRIAIRPPSG